ncbi:unnamed protein product [Schistocephalus solidus]|uniref:Reverse transcriptase domain-containing protein n=1 Tax=Schistocephalus solidus TaxID=70667 RepID=A0A3P7DDK2_SCHSO|nr:unnamed protein product [Schistocephalus solidus]
MLLNIAERIFARILLDCLNGGLEQVLLPESQCEFRRQRGTTEIIFATCQLQEKCRYVCRQGGQKRRYKINLKKSLMKLEINPATWEDLAHDRPVLKTSVKTFAPIFEVNRITAAKAKRAARNSLAPRIDTARAQVLPTCPRYQRTFHMRISLGGHL